jgi:molybdate transport system substrate-binding protein
LPSDFTSQEEKKIMLRGTLKTLAMGVSAACLMMYPAASRAETITIYVAANFVNTLNQLTNDYTNNIDPTASFTIVSGATSTLENTIIALGNTGTGQADLFLAADTAAPQDLYTNHSGLVVGSPFNYAQGYLALWSSPANPVDISAGLPNPFNANFVIADPTTAPYGTAAQQLMAGPPWNYTSPIPGGYVYTSTNIGTTYAAVQAGTYGYGFVALSQVCTYDPNTGTKTFAPSYHYEYDSGYTALIQAGIEINRTTRTPGETDLLNNFVSFMSSTQGLSDILSFCYTTPSFDIKKSHKMAPKKKLSNAH